MHKIVRRGMLGTLIAGGIIAFGATAANAADTASGQVDIQFGTQGVATAAVPVIVGAVSVDLGVDAPASKGSTDSFASADVLAPAGAVAASVDVALGSQGVATAAVPVIVGAASLDLGVAAPASKGSTDSFASADVQAPAGAVAASVDVALGSQGVATAAVPVIVGAASLDLGVAAPGSKGSTDSFASADVLAPAGAGAASVDVALGSLGVAPAAVPVIVEPTSPNLGAIDPAGTGGGTAIGLLRAGTLGENGLVSRALLGSPDSVPLSLGETLFGVDGPLAPVVNPPVVNPPVVNPPVVNPPVVNPPVVNPPVVNPLAAKQLGGVSAVGVAAALARTGVNDLWLPLAASLLLAGLLFTLVARRETGWWPAGR
ncbi:hypothetical protein [Arthrobacter sp. CJ23]|uniref:hypothetical protein n=1 Tax=Arthrobacter sp. CJ23 TaxID=2972479 RepID=UPI00215C90E7|nr:hypothetical protein [Arthrobacter sp. CJ23]UVJ40479.1 hypothetical protein NVV90_04700 [Arthrobacter sp. CJ23]